MKRISVSFCLMLLSASMLHAIDIGTILGGPFQGTSFTAEEKALIRKAAEESDCTVTFGGDGTLTIIDKKTRDKVVFSPSRQEYILYDGADNLIGSYGSQTNVEANAFGNQIPNFSDSGLEVTSTYHDGSSYGIMLKGTKEHAKSYIAKLKGKGFTKDVAEDAQELAQYGISTITFSGSNQAGYTAVFTYSEMAGKVHISLVVSK